MKKAPLKYPKEHRGERLSILRKSDRQKWAGLVMFAAKHYRWRLVPACKVLGVAHRTLQRWAHELSLPSAGMGRPRKRRR